MLPAAARRLDYLGRFADRFGIASRSERPNLGLEDFLERVRTSPGSFSLMPADLPLPPGTGAAAGIESVPIVDPTPL